MRFARVMFFALPAFLISASLMAPAQSNWSVANTVHIGGDGAWDYVTIDQQGHRVFVTRTTHTQAIDGATGKVLGDIPG